MTNFNIFWRRLLLKQPDLDDPESTVSLKSASFKKLLQASYDAGTKDMGELQHGLKSGTGNKNLDNIFRKAGLL